MAPLYDKSTLIDVSATFSRIQGEKGLSIVRKNYGLIGIQHNWSQEQVRQGHIPWSFGRYLAYEKKLIDQGQVMLPPNRVVRANRIIRFLPKPLKHWGVTLANKYYIHRNTK